ncbi:hypothetical protein BC834DRAFT_237844 [Gloeopeniophorella convolvens]|nr:hypothetical protein BC834DRAFT_237844 [Gloeopeniophorella convolvens]
MQHPAEIIDLSSLSPARTAAGAESKVGVTIAHARPDDVATLPPVGRGIHACAFAFCGFTLQLSIGSFPSRSVDTLPTPCLEPASATVSYNKVYHPPAFPARRAGCLRQFPFRLSHLPSSTSDNLAHSSYTVYTGSPAPAPVVTCCIYCCSRRKVYRNPSATGSLVVACGTLTGLGNTASAGVKYKMRSNSTSATSAGLPSIQDVLRVKPIIIPTTFSKAAPACHHRL